MSSRRAKSSAGGDVGVTGWIRRSAMSGKMLVPGTPAGPFPARRASRRRERSARLARLSLPYLSSDRAKSRRSPSRSVESFLTVRGLGFPREFGFGVRRRGVVINSPGTVRISVGTPPFFLVFFWMFQPGVWVSRRSPILLRGPVEDGDRRLLRALRQVHVAHRRGQVRVASQLL